MFEEGSNIAMPEAAPAPANAPPAGTAEAPPGGRSQTRSDVGTALRNGVKLGGSLLATWTVALLLRFLLPRFLGPEQFGTFNFADNLAATYFALLGLGVDTYVQKEMPVRPQHASDFFGSLFALRLVLSGVLLGALALTLVLTHRSAEVQTLVLIFGCGQMFVMSNVTLAAMLQSGTAVGGLAAMNVAGKLLWGGAVLAGLFLHAPLAVLAGAVLVSEFLKAAVLFKLVRDQYELKLRFDARALKEVLVVAFPFYLNTIVITLCSKLDVTLLEFLTGDAKQVGWYSASANVASLAMLMSPLLNWVVMPLMSRAAARSDEELWWVVRHAIAGIYIVTLPIMLMCVLGADVWIRVLFGAAFAPAAMSLRAQAPLFMLTYLAMLLSMTLIIQQKAWKLTLVSLVGVVVNPLLITTLVPAMSRWLGPGGGGVGAALGVVGMESVVTSLLLYQLGRHAIDRYIVVTVGKSLVVCGIVTGLHIALRWLGPLRLAADVVVYVGLMFALGILKLSEVKGVLQTARNKGVPNAA